MKDQLKGSGWRPRVWEKIPRRSKGVRCRHRATQGFLYRAVPLDNASQRWEHAPMSANWPRRSLESGDRPTLPGRYHCLERLNSERIEELLEDTERRDADRKVGLCCRTCGHRISSDSKRIAVAGRHEHSFTNPLGLVYRVGCFAAAAGCTSTGPGTLVDTWFAGFAWRVCHCEQCAVHLGWSYCGGAGKEFYGLILDHIVPCRSNS
jgi:hypothetical protein